MTEQWRDIPGFEGRYLVSDQGRVFSHYSSRVLRPGRMPQGHMSVVLGRKAGSRCVHELVLLAFVGPRPEKHDARHLNGVPSDNRLANLEWSTRRRNIQDKKWHGQHNKLLPSDVRFVRDLLSMGLSERKIAAYFGVRSNTIRNIKTGRAHADVP